ncbi:MAG: hypothetical protein ACR2NL_04875 [Acidimicrobiia bacterium]
MEIPSKNRVFATSAALLTMVLVATSCGGIDEAGDTEPTTTMHGGHDHSDASRTREWEGTPPPVTISLSGDDEQGYVLLVEAPGFVFTGADVIDPAPGEGHAHLFVDGELMTMIYGPEFQLPALDPGTHQLMVTLSTNDHLEYTYDGEPIAAMTILEIEEGTASSDPGGDAETNEIEIQVTVHGAMVHTQEERVSVPLGATVVLTVESDRAENVHVHGYDLFADVSPDSPAVIRFEASIPGIFEVELEGSHDLLVEIQVG